jgi:hypothetical protein
MLEPGQLSYLQNGVYLPGSQALQRARGRTQFGAVTATGTDVDGLRDVQFDNGDHYLVAMISGTAAGNGSYRFSSVGDTGTFANLVSGITAGSQLDVVHYRNRYFLMNGVSTVASASGSNRVVYLSATAAGTAPTVRQHGMLPVDATPTITTAAGTFSQTVTGYYEYWTTEVAKFFQDGSETVLESTFAGKAATVSISATGVVPTIQLPPIKNPSLTTHWRIYRSPKKERENDKKFPSGFLAAEMGTATATQSDSLSGTTGSFVFPTLYNTTGAHSAATNASALGADDAAVATWTTAAGDKSQGVYGFSFGGFSGNVVGIEVQVQGYVASGTGPWGVRVTIGSQRQSGGDYAYYTPGASSSSVAPQSKSGVITSTSAGAPTTLTFGSTTDPWTPPNTSRFTDTDFDSNFMVVVTPNRDTWTNAGIQLAINYVKVRVTRGNTLSGDSVVQFPTVVYTFGDINAQVGKNGPPPSSSTGDLYEDSLVVNDVSNPAIIRYSSPGEPESFPETYFIDFETRDNDNVTNIKVVNGRLMVMLQTAVARVNYLPSERDSSFDRGKAFEWVSRSYGCVSPMCACVFSRDGGQEALAFVSDHGVHITDGYSFDTISSDLNWGNIISRTGTSNAIALINDRDRQELLFYYRNDDNGNETYLCLHFSYSSEHMTGGRLKVSGPVHVRNYLSAGTLRASLESAWSVRRTSGAQDVYLGYGGTATGAGAGFVYRETGTTIPAQDDTLKYATRRMYLAEMGNEWRLNELYGHVGNYAGTPNITYTLSNTKTNDGGATGVGSKSITLAGQPLHKVQFDQMSEGLVVTAQVTATTFAQERLILDGESFGVEDSGR